MKGKPIKKKTIEKKPEPIRTKKVKIKPIRKKWFPAFVLGKTSEKVKNKINMSFPDVEVWVPKSKILAYKDGHVSIDEKNVFDNYLLIKLPENSLALQQEIVNKTPIVYFVRTGDDCASYISEEEEIHLINLQTLIEIKEIQYQSGDKVEVVKGAYSGLVGYVHSVKNGIAKVEINFHNVTTRRVDFQVKELKPYGATGEIKIYSEGEFNVVKEW